MFWAVLAAWSFTFVTSQIISALTTKVPNAAPPSKLGDFDFPTAQESRPIPIITGTMRQSGPNVVWYGDLRINSKNEKVKTSLFTKKTVTVGYYYYLGIQFALCSGPAALKRIWVGDRVVWEGTQAAEGDILLNVPEDPLAKVPTWLRPLYLFIRPLLIPKQPDPPSGILRFYPGNETQTADPYLSQAQSQCPGYRGMCYAVWNGFLGESTQIEPWAFEVERIPNGLGLADPTINTVDANPMNKLYEILVDVYGYTSSDIDADNFVEAAEVLAAEGNGFSMNEDSKHRATQIVQVVEKQINGHIYLDPVSAKWKVELTRDNYELGEIPVLDAGNIIEVLSFDRGAWTGTTNLVTVEFNNRDNEYTDSSTIAQDMANMQIQGQKIATTLSMPGAHNATQASNIAWRELRSLSYPLASVRLKVNRSLWNIHIGKPMLFSLASLVSPAIPMRITRINMGGPMEEAVEIDLVQDVFSDVVGGFEAPTSQWEAPSLGLLEFDSKLLVEAPIAILRRDPDGGGEIARIWAAAERKYRGEVGFKILIDSGGGYYEDGIVYGLAVKATLSSDIGVTDDEIDVETPIDSDSFVNTSDEGVGQNLVNLILIDDEFMAPKSVVNTASGLTLSGIYRGLCDTARDEHLEDADVWLICLGSGPNGAPISPQTGNIDIKLIPVTNETQMDADDVTEDTITLEKRAIRPYPPSLVGLNGSSYPASVDIDSGVTVSMNRRDWRIYDEVSQLETDAESINADFPSANSTQYRLNLLEGGSVIWTGTWNDGSASFAVLALSKIILEYDGLPSELEVAIETRHTYEAVVYEALQAAAHTATAVSGLSGDVYLGIMDTGQLSDPWTAPSTGNYAFEIESSIASDLQVLVNHTFPLQTVILAGNTTGTLTGINAGDIIEVRHADSSSSDQVLLTIDSPSDPEDAFAVLIFDNLYGPAYGGFGIGGFGTGPFGR